MSAQPRKWIFSSLEGNNYETKEPWVLLIVHVDQGWCGALLQFTS